MELERAMALKSEVQSELDDVAGKIQKDAVANLAEVRASLGYTGSWQSEVLPVESGDIDRFVVLSDERGLRAAWMIEVGNFDALLGKNPERGKVKRGGRKQAGKAVLRNAALGAVLRGSGL